MIKMKIVLALSVLLFFTSCEGLPNFMGTDIQKCINCLCHARTGCYSRYNCASYSVSFDYWKTAKSPVLDTDDDPESRSSYEKCMKNENCIVATIVQYADAIGHMDCNCDTEFDCKDRFAIHLFGSECASPKFNKTFATRFNSCSRDLGVGIMLSEEGGPDCTVPAPV